MLFAKNTPGKQCCVIDTVSLVRLCQIELGQKRVIEWILEDFTLAIPQTVFDEGRRNITNDDDIAHTLFFNDIQTHIDYSDLRYCKNCLDNYLEILTIQERRCVDEGEAIAAGLALKLSFVHKGIVLLVTDDFKAIPHLENFLGVYHAGIVKNSYSLLLFLSVSHYGDFSVEDTVNALKDLNSVLRNNDLKVSQHSQKPDELLEEAVKNINRYRLLYSSIGSCLQEYVK